MNKMVLVFISIVTGVWGWSLAPEPNSSIAWLVYEQSLYLSGLLAIALMSLAVMLALRPAWLVRAVGGRRNMSDMHKWAGILTGIFAAFHYLIEMGDDLFEAVFGSAGNEHGQEYSGFIDMMRDAAEEVGEFSVYLLFAMILISLWRKIFPYKYWRYLHRTMPALYLLLVFHAAWLAPLQWWLQPVGIVMAMLLTGGSIASAISLNGQISSLFRLVSGNNLRIN